MRTCPKCAKRLSPFDFRTACKYCGADLLYYHFDERLEQDAAKATAKEEKVRRMLRKLPLPRRRKETTSQ